MRDDLSEFLAGRGASATRPMLGLTLLLVEDSRFASEAIRMMCLRSGARFRRADCLVSAARHLQTYRPAVVIADLGLPDGSGLDLIRQLSVVHPRIPAIIATSGDPGLAGAALAVGADAFLAKPLESLAVFQRTVLGALPSARIEVAADPEPAGLRPDLLALRDDLVHAADMLGQHPDAAKRRYLSRFLSGLALGAHDAALAAAAADLGRDGAGDASVGRLAGLVRERLAAQDAI